MNIKKLSAELIKTLKKYKNLLIYIKGSPDPDALASSYVLKLICESFGVHALIDSPIHLSLPQNIKIVKDLHLPIQFESLKKSAVSYNAYAVLDHPSAAVDGITGVIPCAIHIDHHECIEENIPVDFKLIENTAGSTSTIIALLLDGLKNKLDLDESKKIRCATALYLGIQTDTNDFQYANKFDLNAVRTIEEAADKSLVQKISSLPFPKEAVHFLHLALQNQITYNEWLISGIGFIKEKQRDSMAIISDFLLKKEDVENVVIFAIVEKKGGLTLDASFRTKKEKFNLNRIIRRIAKEGGARKYKGAFQVDLDFFRYCQDRHMLWNMVYNTTIEALKKQGLHIRYGKFKRLIQRIKTVFQKS